MHDTEQALNTSLVIELREQVGRQVSSHLLSTLEHMKVSHQASAVTLFIFVLIIILFVLDFDAAAAVMIM